MLEIEDYYGVDEVVELDMWKREFNIPPREMAPVVLEAHGKRRLTAGLWSLMGPWAESLEHANQQLLFFGDRLKTNTSQPESLYRSFVRYRSSI
jgi:putative SOS response-associated peptidase YedK